MLHPLFTPTPSAAAVVVASPASGPGNWAGGPSATKGLDGLIYLAYRLRRPVGRGRGYANIIASSNDGVSFHALCTIESQRFATDSLERPAIIQAPDGTWHCYVSIATPDSLGWRICLLRAHVVSDLANAPAEEILPGDEATAWKDPVVLIVDGIWHMWICRHRIADPELADSMDTIHASSPDGVVWTLEHSPVLSPVSGTWYERGTRLSAVVYDHGTVFATFDGRRNYAENWEERTGFASGSLRGEFEILDSPPYGASGTNTSGALRYLSAVPCSPTHFRLYYELARADGSHDLVSELAHFNTGPAS